MYISENAFKKDLKILSTDEKNLIISIVESTPDNTKSKIHSGSIISLFTSLIKEIAELRKSNDNLANLIADKIDLQGK